MKVTLHVRPWVGDHQAREDEEPTVLFIEAVSLDDVRMGADVEIDGVLGNILTRDLYENAGVILGHSTGDFPLVFFEKLHPMLYERLTERYGLGPMILGSTAEKFEIAFTTLELDVLEPSS